MLHPKNNRIDYGDQLIPPDGYELNRAIGTTYSLELEALMILPVALFYAQTLEGKTEELRYDMLEAITKSAEKITVYYQNGQLKVPTKYHHLMAYWEKGIVPVTMPNHVSSFHPKVWVVRYVCEGKPACYRVLVTSRNLTFARDWDVAFATEGLVGEKEQARNRPLIHFLNYLSAQGKPVDRSFIEELAYVKFDLPEKFDSLKFIPIGIPNDTGRIYSNPLTSGKHVWDDLLIISPFLDKSTLQTLLESSRQTPFLLSTKSELDGLSEKTIDQFEVWQFSTFVEEAEYLEALEEEGEISMRQHLHAKLFVTKQEDEVSWYLGSANCTDPAQLRNVEFMVELGSSSPAKLKPRDVFNSLTDSSKPDGFELFTPYDINARVGNEEQKRIDLQIRKIKYDLASTPMSGKVTKIEGGSAYNLTVEVDTTSIRWPDDYTISVRPLPERQKTPALITANALNTIEDFTNYTETHLSPFLEFKISYKGIEQSLFLLSMDIELPESRLHRIFTSIINSREKFLKYLTFLLTGEETGIIGSKENGSKAITTNGLSWTFDGLPVFEKLLMAASRSPIKLIAVDKLIERLKAETEADDKPIVTAEFEGLWQVFKSYINQQRS